jgi:LacI family transcriptional regulator
MEDIAREANVSITTVSRVIHRRYDVAEDTRKRILEIIKKYSYSIDGIAQSLRKMKTNTIGFVMTQIYPDPFQSAIVMYLEKEARKNNFRLLISNNSGSKEEEKYAIDDFIKYRVSGIVLGYLMEVKNIETIRRNNIPFVLIERRRNLKNVPIVLLDYYEGIKISINHLISKGAKKIGFIGARLGDEVENEIFESYKNTLIKNGLIFDESLVYFGWMDVKTGYKGIKKFIDIKNIPDACIIINDITTLGAMQALNKFGVKIPDDMMIVTSDNTLSGFLSPPISSITFGKEMIAKCSFELIMKSMEDKDFKNKVIILKPRLIERKSSKS